MGLGVPLPLGMRRRGDAFPPEPGFFFFCSLKFWGAALEAGSAEAPGRKVCCFLLSPLMLLTFVCGATVPLSLRRKGAVLGRPSFAWNVERSGCSCLPLCSCSPFCSPQKNHSLGIPHRGAAALVGAGWKEEGHEGEVISSPTSADLLKKAPHSFYPFVPLQFTSLPPICSTSWIPQNDPCRGQLQEPENWNRDLARG